ncbi:MAG: glycine--tRNA ligase [archaeon]
MESQQDKIISLAKRRGLIYPSSEIYSGLGGLYDYGSNGAKIKRNLEQFWLEYFLNLHHNFHEVSPALIMPEGVFKGSGHLEHFEDPVAECGKCGTSVRADHILEEFLGEKFEGLSPEELNKLIKKHKVVCPKCKSAFKEIEGLQLMFPMSVGAGKGKQTAYLRPETAQGAFVAFKQEFDVNRKKLPLGLAVVGKAFRNEISPRQFVLRMREFSQAELQIFFDPANQPEVPFKDVQDYKLRVAFAKDKEAKFMSAKEFAKKAGMDEFFVYFMAKCQHFMERLGFGENFRFKELSEEERAFYNKYHWDMEIMLPSFDKWTEIAGFHYRTDHDLAGHAKVSKEKLEVMTEKGKVLPHVLELSFGVDRLMFALIDCNYTEDGDRVFLKLPREIAPYDFGIFPLVNKDGIDKKAQEIYTTTKSRARAFYDESGSIGKRYARADEIGVPFCVTIDYDTLNDDTVTLRERDNKGQKRVKIEDILKEI